MLKYYKKMVNLIEKYNKYKIIICILTCNKNINRLEVIKKYWVNELYKYDIEFYFIISSKNIDDTYIDGNILYVKLDETYENLPKKMFCAYEYLYNNKTFEYIYKIDDDCVLNIDNMLSFNYQNYDYIGHDAGHDGFNRTWHYNKCDNPSLNITPYNKPYLGQWCAGGCGYYLSKKSVSIIVKNKNFIFDELYEDKAFGDILRLNNIKPHFEINREQNKQCDNYKVCKFNNKYHDIDINDNILLYDIFL